MKDYNITTDAKNRVDWIDKRIGLNDQQKEYVEFQIKEAVVNYEREANGASNEDSALPIAGVSLCNCGYKEKWANVATHKRNLEIENSKLKQRLIDAGLENPVIRRNYRG